MARDFARKLKGEAGPRKGHHGKEGEGTQLPTEKERKSAGSGQQGVEENREEEIFFLYHGEKTEVRRDECC